MASVRFYTAVYVALVALAASKWAFFEGVEFGYLTYNMALGLTMLTASIKTLLIVAYYQHLKQEPRALAYLMSMALVGVLLLTIAASYSIL